MNYFFFLDHVDTSLNSSIEICNFEPISNFYKNFKNNKYIYYFYISDGKWKNGIFDKILYGKSQIIKKSDLPSSIKDKTVFLSITSKSLKSNHPPFNDNSLNSIPAWRSNIKIFNQNVSCSYQGELPGTFIDKKLSLVSCSPFLQLLEPNIQNYFYLVNIYKEPILEKFNVEILDSKKNLLKKIECTTNSVNCHDLSFLNKYSSSEKMFIFRSDTHGGVPVYFSKNKSNTQMSLEHTHPPTEYIFQGDRLFFQKKKKSYWFG